MSLLLLRPLWLVALPPLALAAWAVWRRQAAGGWEAIIAPRLLGFMRANGYLAPTGQRWPLLVPFAVAGLAVVALSGPARLREDGVAFERLDPLVLLIDLSASVTASASLGDAQAAAALVLQTAGGRPVGMMLYASDAFLASAPTSDAATLESLVAVLGPDTMPVGGSRPDIALAEAARLFAAPGMPGLGGTDLVLVSDGGGAGARAVEEAAALRARGARVWALALDRADLPPDAPAPDAEALAAVAAAGGGGAAPAREARALLEEIAAARAGALARGPEASRIVQDFGRWLPVLAMPVALLLFRPERRPAR